MTRNIYPVKGDCVIIHGSGAKAQAREEITNTGFKIIASIAGRATARASRAGLAGTIKYKAQP